MTTDDPVAWDFDDPDTEFVQRHLSGSDRSVLRKAVEDADRQTREAYEWGRADGLQEAEARAAEISSLSVSDKVAALSAIGALPYGSQTVQMLEHLWAEIQRKHPDVPDAVITTGTGRSTRGRTMGHYAPERWQRDGSSLPEVFVSGECMADGPVEVLTTLLHEAAHGTAFTRGIEDTDATGRYHNRRFADIATELGMEPPLNPHKQVGFSEALVPGETLASYAVHVLMESPVIIEYTPDPDIYFQERKPASGRLTKLTCQCRPARIIRSSAKVAEGGPISCGVCRSLFTID